MKIGITFSAFDLLHAGHVLMLQEAHTVCDHMIACIQSDPTIDRPEKNPPVQSLIERQIQVEACKYVDQIIVYSTEADLVEILQAVHWDVRVIGEEYREVDFTGRSISLDKCYFNSRPHKFSSSELRQRVADQETPEPIDTPV
jgi:glycerol-3-phosphate cytidylyltransferase